MSYDATKYSAVWGVAAARGYADGENINVTFDNDEWTAYTGTQGEGQLVYSPNGSGTVTITLQANSPTNTAWSLLYDAKTPLPLTVIDRSTSGEVFACKEAMPKKKPDMVRGREAPVKQWVFAFVQGTTESTVA